MFFNGVSNKVLKVITYSLNLIERSIMCIISALLNLVSELIFCTWKSIGKSVNDTAHIILKAYTITEAAGCVNTRAITYMQKSACVNWFGAQSSENRENTKGRGEPLQKLINHWLTKFVWMFACNENFSRTYMS